MSLYISGTAVFTGDPEIRYLQSGTAVANASLVFNETWKNDAGEKQERAHFYRATWWGGAAETINRYFGKGQPIQIVKGIVDSEAYTAKDGTVKSSTIITVKEWEFVVGAGKKKDVTEEPEAHEDTPF